MKILTHRSDTRLLKKESLLCKNHHCYYFSFKTRTLNFTRGGLNFSTSDFLPYHQSPVYACDKYSIEIVCVIERFQLIVNKCKKISPFVINKLSDCQ